MRLAITLVCVFLLVQGWAQNKPAHYTPREHYHRFKTYPEFDQGLLKPVEELLDKEVEVLKSPLAGTLNRDRKKYFINLLDQDLILHDDTLQIFVNQVASRLQMANAMQSKPRYFFIVKDPQVNAHCLGDGVFLINVGLLGRISNEAQLAFVLAHEMAHDELDHSIRKIDWLLKKDFTRLQRERIRKMVLAEISLRDIKGFRELNFQLSTFTRRHEVEADSLGLVLYRKAGYSLNDVQLVLQTLHEDTRPKYPLNAETILALDSDEFPFDPALLNSRLKVFSKSPENDFLFNLDSLKSHPDIPVRKNMLATMRVEAAPVSPAPLSFTGDAIRLAEFEAVESAFDSRRYDVGMMNALTLLQKYPRHPYLVSRIAGMLLQLHVAVNDKMVQVYVPDRTVNYSDELKLINDFLHNLDANTISQMLYHFLNRNFDENERDHYYIMWKLAEMNYKYDVQKKFAHAYKERFGKSITQHDYVLHTVRKLNIFDFIGEWGWVFL